MPTSDDERFESYLKQFHPLVPDALPVGKSEGAFSRQWALRMWAVSAATVIVLSVLSFRLVHRGVPGGSMNPEPVGVIVPMQPLTMRDANALLAGAPSYQAALDNLAFHHWSSTVPKDKQSALAVLAKEKIKL